MESKTDREVVAALIRNDATVVKEFFYTRCTPLLRYIVKHVYNGTVCECELISELYLYLSQNDWHKLRQFEYKCKLSSWLSVVATRYFVKKRDELIGGESQAALIDSKAIYNPCSYADRRIDVRSAIQKIRNERYRMVIMELDIRDTEPEVLAQKMGITVDNLYNIHRRAYAQLGMVMKRREEYDCN